MHCHVYKRDNLQKNSGIVFFHIRFKVIIIFRKRIRIMAKQESSYFIPF